jgi:anti-sigma factor RsiW
MSNRDPLAIHVPDALLIGAIDDELPSAEAVLVVSHIAACQDCAQRYHVLRQLSTQVESVLTASSVEFSPQQRDRLERQLQSRELTASMPHSHPLRRLSWAVAIAAALAFALMFVPQWKRSANPHSAPGAALQPSSFQLDGETFVALPYSNPDLPLNSSHIVRMQVPVSSLAQAGVVFEPISNEASGQDRSVLADVLLGMDGQPLGVHVLNSADN